MSAGGFGDDYPEPPHWQLDPDAHVPAFRRSWRPVDLSVVLDGSWQPPEPTIGRRSDGCGLLYAGRVHTVSSESEGGKTWFALSITLDELAAGHHVAYVDFEDSEGGIVGRLLTLGADRDVIRDRFHYLRPEDAIGTGIHQQDLVQMLGDTKPTLAVIDGVTEAMTMHGLDPNSNKDAAMFGRLLPKRLAAAGAASLALDHVTKSTENRGRYSLGAVHKLNAVDGAAFALENRRPFGVGITGRSTVRIAKDRPGQLRKRALPNSSGMFWLGDLVLTSHAEDFSEVEIAAPEAKDPNAFRPTVLMAAIMAAVVEHGPLSKRRIRVAVKGKATSVDQALDQLIHEEYLTEKTPHTLLKPWVGEQP